jgi:hypothetical protein
MRSIGRVHHIYRLLTNLIFFFVLFNNAISTLEVSGCGIAEVLCRNFAFRDRETSKNLRISDVLRDMQPNSFLIRVKVVAATLSISV